jgi:tetratricopeptide (TPR) repeat protein
MGSASRPGGFWRSDMIDLRMGKAAVAPSPRRREWPAMAVLCAVTLVAYANSFSAGFAFDNAGLLLQDPRIRDASAENLRQIFQHTYWWPYGESGLYRPFTTLSYLFNYAILGNGADPTGYHWINFLLHALNVLLVFALARRLVHKRWPSFFIAAVWAVHPVLTESVTNMVGRADLLAGATLLGGLLIYLKSTEAEGGRRWAWLAALGVVTTIGVFSKENAATIAGLIALYELTLWKERRKGKALLLGSLAVLPALGLMWYARAAVFFRLPPTRFPYWDNPLVDASFWTAKLTALKVLAKYIGLLVWPAHLSCDYSYAQIPPATGAPGDWLAWLAVAATAAAVAWTYRKNRVVFFLVAATAITFLPASNLLFPIGTIMAERFLYLPAIALAAGVVLGAYWLAERLGRARLAPVVLCVIIAAFTVRTWARNADWQDDVSLMTAAARVSPASYKPHYWLALTLYHADPSHANIDRVIAEAEKSVAILDPVADWHNNPDPYRRAGGYYLAKGEMLADGTPAYRRSLELLLRCRRIVEASVLKRAPEPDETKIADLERAISGVYLRLGNARKAAEAAVRARDIEPTNAANYRQLAAALKAGGRADDAAVALVEGTILTSDMGLRREWIDLYRGGLDVEGCATRPGPYGPAINPACGIVRKHFCAATVEILGLYRRMGREDLREQLVAGARRDFGCQ